MRILEQGGVDWLGFTLELDGDDCIGQAAALVGALGGGQRLEHGRWGYDAVWACREGAWVAVSTIHARMGCHVELPGGCLETMIADEWEFWVGVASGGAITRLDLALDTLAVPLAIVQQAVLDGAMVTPAKRLIEQRSSRLGRGRCEAGGGTLYVGSPHSDTRCRIYDKRAEQASRVALEQLPATWTRLEVQYRRERAQLSWALLIECKHRVAEVVCRFVDFRVPAPTHSERRRRLSWWISWIQDAVRAAGRIPPKVPSLERISDWLHRSVAPSVALLRAARGRSWVHQLLRLRVYDNPQYKLALVSNPGRGDALLTRHKTVARAMRVECSFRRAGLPYYSGRGA